MKSICLIELGSDATAYYDTLPARLREQGTLVAFNPRENVVMKGNRVETAYLILEGQLTVLYETPDGKSYSWLPLLPYTLVSDLEIFSQKDHYAADVMAVDRTMALKIPISVIRKAFEESIAFTMDIVTSFAKNSCHITYDIENIVYKSGYEKVGMYILKHYMHCSLESPLPFTRMQMAEALGLSLKTVNRSIARLKAERLIQVTKGKVRLENQGFERLRKQLADG